MAQMNMADFPILTAMLAVPLLGAVACLFTGAQAARWIALARDAGRLWRSASACGPPTTSAARNGSSPSIQPLFGRWFNWALGIDGIALLLIVLTAFLMPICIAASWESIDRRGSSEYMAAFLFMETLMIGVFVAQDLFLFYIFFEAGLIPMYLIIGVWGGKERIYAAYKFFLYTLLGSVLMLIAMLWMVNYAGTTFIPDADGHRFPGAGADLAVARLLRQLRGQDADVAGPHLAARRARPGADRGLGDPRRRAAEDGRLRLRPLLAADVPRGVGAARSG